MAALTRASSDTRWCAWIVSVMFLRSAKIVWGSFCQHNKWVNDQNFCDLIDGPILPESLWNPCIPVSCWEGWKKAIYWNQVPHWLCTMDQCQLYSLRLFNNRAFIGKQLWLQLDRSNIATEVWRVTFCFLLARVFFNTYLKIKRVSEINILQTHGLKFEAPKSWRSLHREAHQNRKARQSCSMSIHLLACWAHGASFVECRCQNGVRYVWEVLCVLQNKGSSNKGSVNFASINELSCTFKTLRELLRFWIFMPLITLVEWNWTKTRFHNPTRGMEFCQRLIHHEPWKYNMHYILCITWGLLKSVAPLETLCCFTWIACHNAGRLQGILNQSYYS